MKQSQVQGNWQQIRLLEQKEALSRGEGISGKKGEGFVGTIIKDTWTILGSRGGNRREMGRVGG